MRKVFLAIFAVIMTVGSLAACKVSAENTDPAFCGKSEKILFGFDDKHHTQFSIPEAYLYDPYHMYHKVKDPAEFISLRVRKDDFKPGCSDKSRGLDNGKLIIISINKHKPDDFSHLINVIRGWYSVYVKDIGNQFSVYKMKTGKRGNLFVPKGNNMKASLFLVCSHPVDMTTTESLASCKITSDITKTIYAQYLVENISLEDAVALNRKIKSFLSSFIMNPNKENKP